MRSEEENEVSKKNEVGEDIGYDENEVGEDIGYDKNEVGEKGEELIQDESKIREVDEGEKGGIEVDGGGGIEDEVGYNIGTEEISNLYR